MSNNTNIIDNIENNENNENIDNMYVKYYKINKTVEMGIDPICVQSNPPQHKYYIINYNTNNEILNAYGGINLSENIISVLLAYNMISSKKSSKENMTVEQKELIDHLYNCNDYEDFSNCEIIELVKEIDFIDEYEENITFKQFIYDSYNSIKQYFQKLYRKLLRKLFRKCFTPLKI